jgi:plasmid stabilization system protein ParE
MSNLYRVLFTCPETAEVLVTSTQDVPQLSLGRSLDESEALLRRYANLPDAEFIFPDIEDDMGAAAVVVVVPADAKHSALSVAKTFIKHGDNPVGILPKGTQPASWRRVDAVTHASPLLDALLDGVEVARANPRAVESYEEALRVLGISRDDARDPQKLRTVYRRRVFEVHPDRGGSPDEMVLVNSAYELLSAQGGGGAYDYTQQYSYAPPPPPPRPAQRPSSRVPQREYTSVLDAQKRIEAAQAAANSIREQIEAMGGMPEDPRLMEQLRGFMMSERDAKLGLRARLDNGDTMRILVCAAPENMRSIEIVGVANESASIDDLSDYGWLVRNVDRLVQASPQTNVITLAYDEALRTRAALEDGAWIIGLRDGRTLALNPQTNAVVIMTENRLKPYLVFIRGIGNY